MAADSEHDTEANESLLGRREFIGAGTAMAITLTGLRGATREAVAATGTEPRIQLGNDYEFDDYDPGDGTRDFRIRHQPSGAEFQYDASAGEWVVSNISIGTLTSALDVDGNDIDDGSVKVYDASTDTVGGGATSADHSSVTTEDATIDTALLPQEDGNSPAAASGANSITLTLSSSYDVVWLYYDALDQATSSNVIDATVNGDTGANYSYTSYGGTETTGASAWERLGDFVGNDRVSGSLFIHPYRDGLGIKHLGGGVAGDLSVGENRNVTRPLDSITLSRGASTDWTVTAYGVTIA